MRQIGNSLLWVGNVRDLRDPRTLFAHGIKAVVDVALEEPPSVLPRELAYVRMPMLDGPGNPSWLLCAATSLVADLIRQRVPTLVCCGAGMSRSPSIAAAALSRAENLDPDKCLERVLGSGPADVAPGLWIEILATLKN